MAVTSPAPFMPMSGRASIPMAFVRAILLAYGKYGADPATALGKAQIPPGRLHDVNGRVTAAQFEVLSWAAMRELDDEALGWFSRKLPWGAYGLLCRASLTSAMLELALRRWCRHHRILTNDIVLTLSTAEGTASLSIEECRDLGAFREFCLVTLFRYVLGYACWAIDSKIVLSSADFPFPAPPHRAIYPAIFSQNLNFCAPHASIRFDARYLCLPLKRDESALNKMLKRALPLTVLPYRRDRLLVERVQQILCAPNSGFPAAEDLAKALTISTRTLHRQLQKEGASLRRLKEMARMELAMQALTRTSRPIKQVALLAGFRNEKSFARAFRQWKGETPSEFRQRTKTG